MRFKAVVFDWAGTVVDFGSFAPAVAFAEAFAALGLRASVAQARAPMGLPKLDHIRAMLADPDIVAQWQSLQGSSPDAALAARIYDLYVPINARVVARHADLVPGAAGVMGWLRGQGLRIGSTTGYVRAIMPELLAKAAAQGFAPDCLVCADDLPETRPGPLGMYKCFVDLGVYPPDLVIKVDDTAPGIAEGRAAGCVTVGVALSGNLAGLTPEALAALPEAERAALRDNATAHLRAAGADHVIDTIADLPALITRLDAA